MTQSWPLRSLTFSKDVKLARMNRGPLPWPQKGGGDRGLGRRGAAFLGERPAAWVSRSQSELCARVAAAGDCFRKWICCPVGAQTMPEFPQKSSQIGVLERVSIETGDADLRSRKRRVKSCAQVLAASPWES